MKTKKEIIEHLNERGYTQKAFYMIVGFLVGQGIIELDEEVVARDGEFDTCDFIEWFDSDDSDNEFDSTLEGFIALLDDMLNRVQLKADYEQEPYRRVKFTKLT